MSRVASVSTEERKFGLTVGGVLATIGALLLFWRHRVVPGWILIAVGGVLVLLGAAAPALLTTPRAGWMSFARALGRINSAIFLFLTFFGILTPLGFVLRLFGRDELRRRRAPHDTMWVPYPERNRDLKHFEKIF